MIGDLYHEYYWGASQLEQRFGHPPRYLPDAPGFVYREEMLYAPDFPRSYAVQGCATWG